MSTVFVVESPNKAKKIREYFPDFTVIATVGHFRDLPEDRLGVEPPEHKPEYVTCKGKSDVEKKLRGAAKGATRIYLATDPDREGEAIAAHVYQCIGAKYKDKMVRATYTEVNKKALKSAMENARSVDWALVRAQEARRVVDRYVGYLVSPVLTSAFRRHHQNLGFLTCGRVQSVAAKLIVERHMERLNFKSTEHYGITVQCRKNLDGFQANWLAFYGHAASANDANEQELSANEENDDGHDHNGQEEGKTPQRLVTDRAQAEAVLKRTDVLTAETVQTKRVRVAPPKPLITSSYVKMAGARFKLTTKIAMSIAQKLFESGLITYHRTDSPFMSEDFALELRHYAGQHHLPIPEKARVYSAGANAQEAHECLRVTDITVTHAQSGDKTTDAVYQAVWLITLQSQLADAIEDRTSVLFNNGHDDRFMCRGVVEVDPGWRRTNIASEQKPHTATTSSSNPAGKPGKNSGTGESIPALPVIQEREVFSIEHKALDVKHTKAPALYTEKNLVAKLEKLGIGRPSTYGSILEKIIDQQYIERDKKLTLSATDLGICTVEALDQYFNFMSYRYTSELENILDKIAGRTMDYTRVVDAVYQALENDIEDLEGTSWHSALTQKITALPDRQRRSATQSKSSSKSSKSGNTTGRGKGKSANSKSSKSAKAQQNPKAVTSRSESSTKAEDDRCPDCGDGTIRMRHFQSGNLAG